MQRECDHDTGTPSGLRNTTAGEGQEGVSATSHTIEPKPVTREFAFVPLETRRRGFPDSPARVDALSHDVEYSTRLDRQVDLKPSVRNEGNHHGAARVAERQASAGARDGVKGKRNDLAARAPLHALVGRPIAGSGSPAIENVKVIGIRTRTAWPSMWAGRNRHLRTAATACGESSVGPRTTVTSETRPERETETQSSTVPLIPRERRPSG